MIHRPPDVGAFQFVVLATLRAAQLMRGCTPRVEGPHKATVTAQLEVSAGKVTEALGAPRAGSLPLGAADTPIEELAVLVSRS